MSCPPGEVYHVLHYLLCRNSPLLFIVLELSVFHEQSTKLKII